MRWEHEVFTGRRPAAVCYDTYLKAWELIIILIIITFSLKMRKVMFWSPCIYMHKSKSIKPNRMKFGGMIGYYPGSIWLDFGIDQGQGQGHEKVNIFFLP